MAPSNGASFLYHWNCVAPALTADTDNAFRVPNVARPPTGPATTHAGCTTASDCPSSTRRPVRLRSVPASARFLTTKSRSLRPGNTVSPPSCAVGCVPRVRFRTNAPVADALPSTRRWYDVPETAVSVARLAVLPAPMSSLDATCVSDPTAVPVYTHNTVSISLPIVSKVTSPDAGAVHVHHSVWYWVAVVPLATGSPASYVAPTLVPAAVALHAHAGSTPRDAKLS